MADKARDYVELLKRLPGVYAANIRIDESGTITEVHMLSAATRHPKQVARDARTALFSAYGLDIDYQKFSVAQLSDALGDSFDHAPQPARLRCGSLEQSQDDRSYSVAVHLTDHETVYTGRANAYNSPVQRQKAVAEAVLDAVHQYLDCDQPVFALMAVRRVDSTPIPVMVVLIECLEKQGASLLVGAAEAGENDARGVQKATLDALNRKLPLLRGAE